VIYGWITSDLTRSIYDRSIADDNRIRSAIPTIRYGRSTGNKENDKDLKMTKVSDRLRELLPGVFVEKSDQVVGERTTLMANELKASEVLLLENLRFISVTRSKSIIDVEIP
jgi:phosphoglycerate kinase